MARDRSFFLLSGPSGFPKKTLKRLTRSATPPRTHPEAASYPGGKTSRIEPDKQKQGMLWA